MYVLAFVGPLSSLLGCSNCGHGAFERTSAPFKLFPSLPSLPKELRLDRPSFYFVQIGWTASSLVLGHCRAPRARHDFFSGARAICALASWSVCRPPNYYASLSFCAYVFCSSHPQILPLQPNPTPRVLLLPTMVHLRTFPSCWLFTTPALRLGSGSGLYSTSPSPSSLPFQGASILQCPRTSFVVVPPSTADFPPTPPTESSFFCRQ